MKSEASLELSRATRSYSEARKQMITKVQQAQRGSRFAELEEAAYTLGFLYEKMRRAEHERLTEVFVKATKRNGLLQEHGETAILAVIDRALTRGAEEAV